MTAGVAVVVALSLGGLWYRAGHVYRVDEVIDGDTLRIQYHGTARLVQLAGADAPEMHKGPAGQPLADAATQYLTDRVLHKSVWIEFEDPGVPEDDKGRLVCWVWRGAENLSYSLIARGLARSCGTAEGKRRTILAALEQEARIRQRGVWALMEGRPVPGEENDGAEALYKQASELPQRPDEVR